MNGWIPVLFIICTVFVIIEVAVSMHRNTKQAYIAAEKELQHIRRAAETFWKAKRALLRQGDNCEQHPYVSRQETIYRQTACPQESIMQYDPYFEAERQNMEDLRLASQRDMAFAYMAANQAMQESMGEAERNMNNTVHIDNTMFF